MSVLYRIPETTEERRGTNEKRGRERLAPSHCGQISRYRYFADLNSFATCLSTYRFTDFGNALSPSSFFA